MRGITRRLSHFRLRKDGTARAAAEEPRFEDDGFPAGTAAPHLKALVAGTQQAMKAAGVQSYRTSGDPDSGWVVVDYVDVVVHVFTPEARAYYALEKLWEKQQ